MMTTAFLLALLASAPKVGELAPDFTVKDIDGRELTLSKLVERGPVVLAFFPKAFTGGCTRELTSYRDRMVDIEKHHGTVIAVSTDDRETQLKFKASLTATYSFVADHEGKLVNAYDLKMPILSMSKRATFVIGAGRKVLSVQEGSDAIETSAAVNACSVAASQALQLVTGAADAGRP